MNEGSDVVHRGGCLCGAVTFAIEGDLGSGVACHCTQCRKQSGHYWAAIEIPRNQLTVTGEESLTWYQASTKVRRGFCRTCGSFLFWDPLKLDKIGVALGAIDGPTDTRLALHIFVADKGDYYEIADGVPQNEQ